MKLSSIIAAIFLLVFSMGCATTDSLRNSSISEGVPRTFNTEFERVLKASRESVVEVGLNIEDAYQANDHTWVILAKKPTSAWSWGELVRVVVEKNNENETIVRVLTKRKLATNVTAKGDYSNSILSNIALKLQ